MSVSEISSAVFERWMENHPSEPGKKATQHQKSDFHIFFR